ncbi:uncharacterized protein METZ01_LOCUS476540 [marine metagenome]|uniref:Uncharacterized protein n=1 Tax=marine metagenome TaxID=408172 RepID=A0A383BTU5_9ZZZZ
MADIMFYSYCKAFSINPVDARNTPISLMKKMLEIQSVVTEIEQDQLDQLKK